MQLKLNNGRGALICDRCSIIIMNGPFSKNEWSALSEMNKNNDLWYCMECDSDNCIKQTKKFNELISVPKF